MEASAAAAAAQAAITQRQEHQQQLHQAAAVAAAAAAAAAAASAADTDKTERVRLEALRQKSCHKQSAVARYANHKLQILPRYKHELYFSRLLIKANDGLVKNIE